MNRQQRPGFTILIGVVLLLAGIALTVHDREFLLTGNTVDLNEILQSGGEAPRDKYVTYAMTTPLGNYAESKTTYAFIPMPFLTAQLYGFIGEDGNLMSIKVRDKKLIQELDAQLDAFYSDEEAQSAPAVTVTGCVNTIKPELRGYYEDYMWSMGMKEEDIQNHPISYICIDTTKTRAGQAIFYTLAIVLGIFMIVSGIKGLKKA